MDIEKPIRITMTREDAEFPPRVIRAALLRAIHLNVNVRLGEWERVLYAESIIHGRCGDATQSILCTMGIFAEYNVVRRMNANGLHVVTRENGSTVMADDFQLSGGLVWAMDVWRIGHDADVIWAAFQEGCRSELDTVRSSLADWS